MQEEVSGEAWKLRGRAPEKQAALMETSQWLTPPLWFPWGQDRRWSSGVAAAADVACSGLVGGGGVGVAPGREPWDVAGVRLGAGPCSHSCGGQL